MWLDIVDEHNLMHLSHIANKCTEPVSLSHQVIILSLSQDMEISANELKNVLNRVITKRESILQQRFASSLALSSILNCFNSDTAP